MQKIQHFTDLNAWKKGHQFVIKIYKITQGFPKAEEYGLKSQIRRAAVSITSNIAEGYGRRSYKEKAHFYQTSLGSVNEVQSQLLIARDIGYLDHSDFDILSQDSITVHKMINGLIKGAKKQYA